MVAAKAEWWNRVAIPARPEVSIPDKLKQAVELMAASVGRAIGWLVDPPYPMNGGRPLAVKFYGPGEPGLFSKDQLSQLAAIVKWMESGHQV